MKLSADFSLSVNGDGYSEGLTTEGRFYIHRLSAVAEHGTKALEGKDVHHEEHQWVNNPSKLTPEDPSEHRKRTLANVEGGSQ